MLVMKSFSKENENDILNQLNFNEIEILRRISHPGIINLHEIYENENCNYIIFDYFTNSTLDKMLINKTKLSISKILKIMYQILSALKFLHEKNIMHRNINLKNILIDSNFLLIYKILDGLNVKIGNFNFATYSTIPLNSQFIKYCGNPKYYSPELLKQQNYNEKIDIFAVGMIFLFLISGKEIYPFTVEKIVNCERIQLFKKKKRMKFILDYNKRISAKDALQSSVFYKLFKKQMKTKPEAELQIINEENDFDIDEDLEINIFDDFPNKIIHELKTNIIQDLPTITDENIICCPFFPKDSSLELKKINNNENLFEFEQIQESEENLCSNEKEWNNNETENFLSTIYQIKENNKKKTMSKLNKKNS